MSRRIYVASSWRNVRQPEVVAALRAAGHEVYDFRNPEPGNAGFGWRQLDPEWQRWTPEQYRAALQHPVAEAGFRLDFAAMQWADTFVLVLPCGRSAHLELGWACGAGKETVILLDTAEPELMAKMATHLCLDMEEVLAALQAPPTVNSPAARLAGRIQRHLAALSAEVATIAVAPVPDHSGGGQMEP